MHGRVQGDCLVILDSFALPVQGTETRVNAGNEALEYMSQYTESTEKVRLVVLLFSRSSTDSQSNRRGDKRMSSDGTTPILATGVGYRVSMCLPSPLIKNSRILSSLSWYVAERTR